MINFALEHLFFLLYNFVFLFVVSPTYFYFCYRLYAYNATRRRFGLSRKSNTPYIAAIPLSVVLNTVIYTLYLGLTGDEILVAFGVLLFGMIFLYMITVIIGLSRGLDVKGSQSGYLAATNENQSHNISKLVKAIVQSNIIYIDSEYATPKTKGRLVPQQYPEFEWDVCEFLDSLMRINEHPHLSSGLELKSIESDTLGKLALVMTILESDEKMNVLNEDYVEGVTESLRVFKELSNYIVSQSAKYESINLRLSSIQEEREQEELRRLHEVNKDKIKIEMKDFIASGKTMI